jgi:hypothetical protein
MKQNTLNIILFTITSIVLIFVVLISFWIQEDINEQKIEPKTIEKPEVNLNYTPDSKYLAITESNKLMVFEIKSGKKILEIGVKGQPDLVFSPDSSTVSFIDVGKKIKVINLNQKNSIKTIEIK